MSSNGCSGLDNEAPNPRGRIRLLGPIIGFGRLKGKPFYTKRTKAYGFLMKLGGARPDEIEDSYLPYLEPLPKTKVNWDALCLAISKLRVTNERVFDTLVELVDNLIASEEREDAFFKSYDREISHVIAVSLVVHCAFYHDIDFAYVVKKYITSFARYPSSTAVMLHQKGFLPTGDSTIKIGYVEITLSITDREQVFSGRKSAAIQLIEKNMDVIVEFDKQSKAEGYY